MKIMKQYQFITGNMKTAIRRLRRLNVNLQKPQIFLHLSYGKTVTVARIPPGNGFDVTGCVLKYLLLVMYTCA